MATPRPTKKVAAAALAGGTPNPALTAAQKQAAAAGRSTPARDTGFAQATRTATAAPRPATPASERSAKAILAGTLAEWGLASLADWAWQEHLGGAPDKQIFLESRKRPEHKARFIGFEELQATGRGVDEGTWIAMEKSFASQMHAYGLPPSFYDGPEDFGKLITGEVSTKEFGDRLEMASRVVATDPRGQTLRSELASKYGFTNADGLALAYWLDPDKGADLIQKQYQAATSSAASVRAGFGSLSLSEAERVGAGRYSEDYLSGQFGKIAQMGELLSDVGGSGSVSRADLIGAGVEGNAVAAAKVEGVSKKRVAEFHGGGGFSSSQGGITGLGSASG